jgi:molybdate transport system permease protein
MIEYFFYTYEQDLLAIWLTIKLALYTTGILLLIGMPLAWWLSRTQNTFKPFIEALISLPIILPPTVLGFYFLFFFSPNSTLGEIWTSLTGTSLAFNFSGILFGSIIYSLPFVVQPLHHTFNSISKEYLDMASGFGLSRGRQFFSIILPLAKPGIITASILGFAHTVGEFGVVIMIGGNIPGETQVLSILLYDHVENFNYYHAHVLSLSLMIFSFITLLILYTKGRHYVFH